MLTNSVRPRKRGYGRSSGTRFHRWVRRRPTTSGATSGLSLTARFASTCSRRRMPGIVVVTAGFDRMNRSARSGSDIPSAAASRPTAWTRGSVSARCARSKVGVAPVALRPLRVGAQRAREAPFIEWHACDHRDAAALARGKECVLGGLIEDVVDHLHGIDQPGLQRAEHIVWFPPIDADPERADLP